MKEVAALLKMGDRCRRGLSQEQRDAGVLSNKERPSNAYRDDDSDFGGWEPGVCPPVRPLHISTM